MIPEHMIKGKLAFKHLRAVSTIFASMRGFERVKCDKDRIGARYGMWTLVSIVSTRLTLYPKYICRCDCGTERAIVLSVLQEGLSKHCGCQNHKEASHD